MEHEIIFVTFHTTDRTWENSAHPYGGNKSPHTELLPYFIASIRSSCRSARIVLLTDEHSQADPGFDTVIRTEVRPEKLMLERAYAQLAYLAGCEEGQHIVLIDTDTIVVRDVSDVFAIEFDVAVTIRDSPQYDFEKRMPYNNGIVYLRNTQSTQDYLRSVIECNEEMEEELHAWSGNQFAVLSLLGRQEPYEVVRIGSAKVLILPCDPYNYTPDTTSERIHEKFILHFRGNAKRNMIPTALILGLGNSVIKSGLPENANEQ